MTNNFNSSYSIMGTQKLLETAGNKNTIVIDGYLTLTDVDGKDHHIKVACKGSFVNWRNVDYFRVVHESGGEATITTAAVYTAVWSDIFEKHLPLWEKTSEEVSVKGVVIKRWSINDDILWYEENERAHRPRRPRWNDSTQRQRYIKPASDSPQMTMAKKETEDQYVIYRSTCVECGKHTDREEFFSAYEIEQSHHVEGNDKVEWDDAEEKIVVASNTICKLCHEDYYNRLDAEEQQHQA